ncbi:hypothetical protein N7G274_000744 [Stereocaulon virgatum]|uniref:Uncharacterized protein n=1 Tax=Stereocaulon virgatum TaxID=373712 RepID=A0ABR4AS74_9LECA
MCEFTLDIIHEFGNIFKFFVTFIQGAVLSILQYPLEREYSLRQALGQTLIVPRCFIVQKRTSSMIFSKSISRAAMHTGLGYAMDFQSNASSLRQIVPQFPMTFECAC